MSDLPEPLTPADCDLQDFAFMPLDVARLRDSDLAADETPEACWAAVLLWAASWHQIPAASIPDNENWIAKTAGYAARGKIDKEWKNVREGALRGWIKCSDGRLYHPVVAEKARDAWQAKGEQRWRTECSRIKKHNQRHRTNIPLMDFDAWTKAGRPQGQPLFVPEDNSELEGDSGRDNGSKRQGEGQGQGDSNSVPKGTGAVAPEGLSPQEAIFQIAVPWLVANGGKEGNVRSLLGGAVKQLGPDAAWALASQCMTEKPIEPIAWLAAGINAQLATRGIGRKNPGGKGQPAPDNFAALDYGTAGKL